MSVTSNSAHLFQLPDQPDALDHQHTSITRRRVQPLLGVNYKVLQVLSLVFKVPLLSI